MAPDWASCVAARRPRSSTSARTRQATPLSSQRRVALETRPATSSSARRFVRTSQRRQPLAQPLADEWRGRVEAAPRRLAQRDQIEGSVDVHAEPPARAQVRDGHAGLLLQPPGKGVVGGEWRQISRSAAREIATTSAE